MSSSFQLSAINNSTVLKPVLRKGSAIGSAIITRTEWAKANGHKKPNSAHVRGLYAEWRNKQGNDALAAMTARFSMEGLVYAKHTALVNGGYNLTVVPREKSDPAVRQSAKDKIAMDMAIDAGFDSVEEFRVALARFAEASKSVTIDIPAAL